MRARCSPLRPNAGQTIRVDRGQRRWRSDRRTVRSTWGVRQSPPTDCTGHPGGPEFETPGLDTSTLVWLFRIGGWVCPAHTSVHILVGSHLSRALLFLAKSEKVGSNLLLAYLLARGVWPSRSKTFHKEFDLYFFDEQSGNVLGL